MEFRENRVVFRDGDGETVNVWVVAQQTAVIVTTSNGMTFCWMNKKNLFNDPCGINAKIAAIAAVLTPGNNTNLPCDVNHS